ncbi:MAG: cell division FtsA domain-containing protein, partial [Patescibacteria group bacterium]
IAGELVKGTTNTIRYKRPHPDKELDIAEMEFIIEKVQERAQIKAQKLVAFETGNADVEVKLVNSAIVGIHIDGYKITNPIGFQGKDVAIQIYTAFAPMVHIGALERTAAELDLDLIAVAAEPFAVARSVLGNDAGSTFSAILTDVGGGTTDIAVINDGGVEGTKMFGIGGRSFTRTIATELDLGYDDAEKLKINVDDPNIRENVAEEVNKAIDKTLEVWIGGVELALGEFDSVDHLPNKILLCGGGSSLKKLVKALNGTEWYKDLPFTKKPTVHHISPENVDGIKDKTGEITDHTLITAMGLLRVGYDTMVGTSETDTVKDKLNRILRI